MYCGYTSKSRIAYSREGLISRTIENRIAMGPRELPGSREMTLRQRSSSGSSKRMRIPEILTSTVWPLHTRSGRLPTSTAHWRKARVTRRLSVDSFIPLETIPSLLRIGAASPEELHLGLLRSVGAASLLRGANSWRHPLSRTLTVPLVAGAVGVVNGSVR